MPSTNDEMVEELLHSGAVRSRACAAAFKAVDRGHFWVADSPDMAGVYAEMPLRHGRLHLSAPQIYGEALESLQPLRAGMSFLNVGSGSGYFNSVVSEMIGEQSTNHGIDIWPEVLTHARERCSLLGKKSISFFVGNVYQLDVGQTMRYDRIYLGACANSRSKYLYRLLEVGGILVGPFQAGRTGRIQQLRRVTRRSETEFGVEVLESVRFACLVEPTQTSTQAPQAPESAAAQDEEEAARGMQRFVSSVSDDDGQQVGLPGVPFTFALRERPWSPERCWLYPPSFRQTVAASLRWRAGEEGVVVLPPEMWTQHIFPWCPKWWFEERQRDAPASSHSTPASGPQRSPKAYAACSPAALPEAAEATPETIELPQAACAACAQDEAAVAADKEDTAVSDDADGSTRAASSSRQTTPQIEPTRIDSPSEADVTPLGLDSVMFEVFVDNGQRHAIGAAGDPDDMDVEERVTPQNIPLQVLQLLAAATRMQRREREVRQEAEGQVRTAGDDSDIEVNIDGEEFGGSDP